VLTLLHCFGNFVVASSATTLFNAVWKSEVIICYYYNFHLSGKLAISW